MLMVFSNINLDMRQEGSGGRLANLFLYFSPKIFVYIVLKVLQTILSANLLVTKIQCSITSQDTTSPASRQHSRLLPLRQAVQP